MKSFYLGIDVSKGYADFVIINQQKQQMFKGFQLDDTFEGHNKLYEIIRTFLKDHPRSALYAAVESTGGFENNWYNTLKKFQSSLNIQTARLNPLGVVRNSEADLKRNKTDNISAFSVAEYMVAHFEKVVFQGQDNMAGLRKQWSFIEMLTKQSTQLSNQLQMLLYSTNPELLSFCRDGLPVWVIKLLLQYPTVTKLKNARVKTVSQIPYVTMDRAQQLIAGAKKSVASATDDVTAQLVKALAGQLLHIKKTIDTQTKLMASQCELPEIKLLKTFIGISDKSAIGLMLELQSVDRFKTVKKLAAYWGVHPVYKISGDGIGAFKMSKKGRKNPRKILFNITMSAITYNPVIKSVYEDNLSKGKSKLDAMGVCMHKILRIIYGMLKNKRAFDPKVDKANRHRSLPAIKVSSKANKTRRFQDYDTKAPVSRRQNKKRLEQEPSQSVNHDTKYGIKPPVPIGDIIAKVMSNL